MKYVRFQSQERCYLAPSKAGIFHVAIDLRDDEDTAVYIADELRHHIDWFDMYLPAPRLCEWDYRAIFWFKDTAHEPIAHIWAIKPHLEAYGYWIDVVKTANPGKILYEDSWQIAAKPWRDARH
ncbi:MAG: hypothetical protein AAFN91_06525 [Pseudomonadota bacterium]